MNPIAMTVILVVTLSIFAYSASRRFQLISKGAPEPDFNLARPGELVKRIEQTLRVSLGQQRMAKNEKYRAAGIAHIGIFAAFNVLLLNSILLWFRGYDASFDFWGLLGRRYAAGRRLQLRQGAGGRGRVPGCLASSSTTASSRATSA